MAFPLNLSRQFLIIGFVIRKTYCSVSVKYTCLVSHLSDEKTKGIYIYHIYFEIATILKATILKNPAQGKFSFKAFIQLKV